MRRYDNGDAVVGHQYLGLLETHTPDIQWDEDSEEHFFVSLQCGDLKAWIDAAKNTLHATTQTASTAPYSSV